MHCRGFPLDDDAPGELHPQELAKQQDKTIAADDEVTSQEEKKNSSTDNDKITIFCNLFAYETEDIPRVESIFEEQMALWNPKHHKTVKVRSLGVPSLNLTKPAMLLQHHEKGSEIITLNALWEYCQDYPHQKVIYLHSKGSFHAGRQNDNLRRFVTRAALSTECANHDVYYLPPSATTCNVCAVRISPFPHLHAPGNMWLATCSNLRQLLQPAHFRDAMGGLNNNDDDKCAGAGRFAAEHWILAHPHARPCDLYAKPHYIFGYKRVPTVWAFEANLELAAAPRFGFDTYVKPNFCTHRYNGNLVVEEFRRICNMTPAADWWGWKWFNLTNSSKSM